MNQLNPSCFILKAYLFFRSTEWHVLSCKGWIQPVMALPLASASCLVFAPGLYKIHVRAEQSRGLSLVFLSCYQCSCSQKWFSWTTQDCQLHFKNLRCRSLVPVRTFQADPGLKYLFIPLVCLFWDHSLHSPWLWAPQIRQQSYRREKHKTSFICYKN